MLLLTRRMKEIKREITDHLTAENKSLEKICQKLKLLSRNVRCLKDRPIDEYKFWPDEHYIFARTPNTVLGMGEHTQSIDMQTQLLRFFMEDLQGVWVEREIEKSWLVEARQLNEERNRAMHAFLLNLDGDQQTRNAGSNLIEYIKHTDSMLSDLLEAKKNYGLKLVGRVSARFSMPNSLQPIGFKTIVLSAKERIVPLLQSMRRSVNTRVYYEVVALFSQLEDCEKLLKEMQVSTEGAHSMRKACFEELRNLSCKAEILSLRILELDPYPRVLAHLMFLSQFSSIQKSASLLQKGIRDYRIERVKDSYSVVGLEQDISALVSKLTMPSNITNRSIVCIVGMEGIGKTTLAKEIFNHTTVKSHFKGRRLVTLSQVDNKFPDDVEKVKQVVKDWESCHERERNHYLLVLDNLFSKEAWDALKPKLPVATTNELFKIVITMREKEVASYVQASHIHHLQLRTKEESWELLTQMVPMTCKMVEKPLTQEEEEMPTKIKEALVRKIVRRTGGLPLAIVHVGYVLVGKKVEDMTHEVLSRMIEQVTRGQNQKPWHGLWKKNKEEFKSQQVLSKCISSFEIIPFNYEIPARRVVGVWVARRLVQSEDANETPETVADKYLSELINRNLIQVVERKQNGKVKTCRFPFALRELWLQRPRNSGPIRAWSLATSQGSQLAYHFDENGATHNHRVHGLPATLPNFLHEVRYPRSIMFFDTRVGKQPGDDVGNFIQKGIKRGRFHGLLVLDLEGIFRPHLPKNIGELKHLVYLGLRWTYLETIPSSIGELLKLQTLDMKHTYIRTLPISVWKLKKLRHLYLNEYCRITVMPKPSAMHLEDLQTLSGAFLDEDSPLRYRLDKMKNLRKLGLVFDLTVQQQEDLSVYILQLTQLRSLSLKSFIEKREPQKLKLVAFSDHAHLSVLYLFGKLEEPIAKEHLPTSLTELVLSATELKENDDPMPILGELPNLKSLSLLANSYQGQIMAISGNSFPQLLYLKLWSLPNLKRLRVDKEAMQNIREMEIRSCKELIASTELTRMETLQELKLTNMLTPYVQVIDIAFAAVNKFPFKTNSPKIKVEYFPSNE